MNRLLLAIAATILVVSPALQADENKADDPKSKNQGKIVGKWKLVSVTVKPVKNKAESELTKDEKAALEKAKHKEANIVFLNESGLFMSFEYRPDNVCVIAIESEKPETLALLKQAAPKQKFTFEVKYRLLAGEAVELYGAVDEEVKRALKSDHARSDILIDGDDMTIKDSDGMVTKLVKMKDDKPAKK